MIKIIIRFIIKVSTLSLIIFAFTSLSWCFFSDSTNETEEVKENKDVFVSTKNHILANAWVAITTNVWTKLQYNDKISASIYEEILSVDEILLNEKWSMDKLISKNMIFIKDYLSILRTDLKNELSKSSNREAFLDSIRSGLEIRFRNSYTIKENLNKQREILLNAMSISNDSINQLKPKIQDDFSWSDFEETILNINYYLSLKKQYTYARTYVIFIDQFIKQYNFLDAYNKELLDTIINNKDALVKDTYVVLPDSWTDLVEKLNLLYTEAQFKTLNENNNE